MQEFIRSTSQCLRLRKIPHLLLWSVALFALISCSPGRNGQLGDTESLGGLRSMGKVRLGHDRVNRMTGQLGGGGGKVSHVRASALKDTALSLGAQSGLASRAKYIDNTLVKQTRQLDKVFNFNSLTIEHNILPPVLLEGKQTLNLADEQSIRISDRTFKISKQARFITTPPNWRQYLWMDYKQPERPHPSLLPKTKDEKKIWLQHVEEGWKRGVEQANTIFEENVARIKEDFRGMILYRKLLAMNMVSPPYVSHTDLGVTGDEGEIHIDDRVLRITAMPALNMRSQEWRAAVAQDKDSLTRFRQMEELIDQAKVTITNKAWQPVITPIN